MRKRIIVLAALDQETLEKKGADIETEHDTIREAQKRAKYYLTEDSRLASESSYRLGYAQVLVNGEVHSDYFGKDEQC